MRTLTLQIFHPFPRIIKGFAVFLEKLINFIPYLPGLIRWKEFLQEGSRKLIPCVECVRWHREEPLASPVTKRKREKLKTDYLSWDILHFDCVAQL